MNDSEYLKKPIVIGTAVLLLILVSGLGGYLYYYYNQAPPVTGPTNPYEGAVMVHKDPAYQMAYALLSAGNREGAVVTLKEIQTQYATGTPERNVIDLDIAQITSFGASPSEGIRLLKAIAGDTVSYIPLTRALAIEAMARTHYALHDPAIAAEIFKGDYFSSFLEKAKGDYELAVSEMLRSGIMIYPTPIAALRIAGFDAKILYKEKLTLSEEEKDLRRRSYQEFMSIADSEIKKTEGEETYLSYVAEYYSVKGNAMALMVAASENVPLSEVEAAYKKAVELSSGRAQVFVLFNYGAFLSKNMPNDKTRIEDLANRILLRSEAERATFETFIKNALAAGEKDSAYEWIVVFRKQSPAFDAYVKGI